MKVKLSRDKLKSVLREDVEFRVFARCWAAVFEFDIGDDVYLIKIKEWRVNAVGAHAPTTSRPGRRHHPDF